MFEDRHDAGQRLAHELRDLADAKPVVLALPRGGVPIGVEVARSLDAPLSLVFVRKIGAPGQPELAVGAVVDADGIAVVANKEILSMLGLTEGFVERQARRETAELARRRRLYLRGEEGPSLSDRTVVIVDDGIATGATMRAAIQGLRRSRPARIVLAVPVAAAQTLESLRREVDDVVCLICSDNLGAVGRFYREFRQVSDEEVCSLMRAAKRSDQEAAAQHSRMEI